jgi:hypothetical protein
MNNFLLCKKCGGEITHDIKKNRVDKNLCLWCDENEFYKYVKSFELGGP